MGSLCSGEKPNDSIVVNKEENAVLQKNKSNTNEPEIDATENDSETVNSTIDTNSNQNLIMHGYCRCIQTSLQQSRNDKTIVIPEEIIILCMKYLQVISIINIAVGSCGIKLNNAFHKSIYNEYNLNDNGTPMNAHNRINNVYLTHTSKSNYIPRSILIDNENDKNEYANNILSTVNTNNIIYGKCPSYRNNWAGGYYTQGADIIEEYMNAFRKDIETYGKPLGVQFMYGIGAGGGGLGSLLMTKVKDNYPNLVMTSFAVFPSSKINDVVVYPYNTTLSIAKLSELCDAVFVIDNTALWNIAKYKYKIQLPELSDLNFIANQGINDVTSLFRCNESYGFDLQSFVQRMVTVPKLKYLTISKAPFYGINEKENKIEIVESDVIDERDIINKYEYGMKLTETLFKRKYRSFSDCDIVYEGINLSTVILHRGFQDISNNKTIVAEIENKLKKSNKKTIFDHKSNRIISSSIQRSPMHISESVTMISNSTAIKSRFQKTAAQYARLYQRKAFLHWYKGEGMDEMEFQEADKLVRDIITLYEDYNDFGIKDVDEESESEQTDYEETVTKKEVHNTRDLDDDYELYED